MARVLITGASRGLGRALAAELTRRGHQVVATARRSEDLADLPVAGKLVLDVTDPSSVSAAAEAGPIDVVINNAAVTMEGPVEAIPVEKVEQLFDTNVFGPLRVMQTFVPGMRERGHGMIVNISSVGAQFAPPLQGVYSASKAALEMLSEALHFELQHFGIRVVVIQAGGIRTDLTVRQPKYSFEAYTPLVRQQEQRMEKYATSNGGAAPEEIASAIADVMERKNPALRIPVGTFGDRVFARLGKLGRRLVKMGLDW